jgi:hypothetical protein
MTKEFWKWPETSCVYDAIDWKKAEKLTAGVDIGTTSSQAVVLCDGVPLPVPASAPALTSKRPPTRC